MNRIRHYSIPDYLAAIRAKAAEFGKEALSPYEEPKALCLGFTCGDEAHVIGINNIRAHYNIQRNIPCFVIINMNPAPSVSQEDGIKMFVNDCKEALNSNKHGLS